MFGFLVPKIPGTYEKIPATKQTGLRVFKHDDACKVPMCTDLTRTLSQGSANSCNCKLGGVVCKVHMSCAPTCGHNNQCHCAADRLALAIMTE